MKNLKLVFLTGCLFTAFTAQAELVINEVMSSSETDYIKGISYSGDWIELYNTSGEQQNLADYGIADGGFEDGVFYGLPESVIGPYGFVLLLASDDTLMESPFMGLPFKLKSGGEPVMLYKSGNLIDRIDVPSLETDISYGRFPDGTGELVELPKPSAGVSNVYSDQLRMSHTSGIYKESFELKVESELGLIVYVTDDGSTPNQGSRVVPADGLVLEDARHNENRFSIIPTTPPNKSVPTFNWVAPIEKLEKINILRFASIEDGINGAESFGSYYVNKYADSRFRIPMVSLYTDPLNLFSDSIGIYVPGDIHEEDSLLGNYFMKGREWERETVFEYILPDGRTEVSQIVGLRTRGNTTRASVQKSLRIYARDEYEDKDIDFDFFGTGNDSYEKLEFANSISEWSSHTYIRNQIMYELAKQMDLDYPETAPVSVFLNGEYWGLHTLRERIDEEFISERHGIEKDSINMISRFEGYVDHGTNRQFLEMIDIADKKDLSVSENYNEISEYLDIDNFINYQILYNFCAIIDWPNNNLESWNALGVGSKIRFLPLDGDSGFYEYESNMFEHATQDSIFGIWPNGAEYTMLFRKLLDNEHFRSNFAERYQLLLSTVFRTKNLDDILYRLRRSFNPEVENHIRRFPFPPTMEIYHFYHSLLDEFMTNRSCEVTKQLKAFFPEQDITFDCGINTIREFPNYFAHPNPASDRVTINSLDVSTGEGFVSVYDAAGRLTAVNQVDIVDGSVSVGVDDLVVGNYYCLIFDSSGDVIGNFQFQKE